jgi:hypothetical protein
MTNKYRKQISLRKDLTDVVLIELGEHKQNTPLCRRD